MLIQNLIMILLPTLSLNIFVFLVCIIIGTIGGNESELLDSIVTITFTFDIIITLFILIVSLAVL